MHTNQQQTISYEGWICDLAYALAGEYAMHGDGEPRAHYVLEDAVLEQLAPVEFQSDGRRGQAGIPAYLRNDPDPAGRTRLLLYALYESLWPWSGTMGFPERTLIVEADDRWQAYVVGMCGPTGGERLVVFSEDVDLRSLICRTTEDLHTLYERMRDKVDGRDLPNALRGRREHLCYAPLFEWAGAENGAEDGTAASTVSTVYHLCEDCAARRAARSVDAHDPVQKIGPVVGLADCEDCGAVNAVKHPEGRLPVLVGRHATSRPAEGGSGFAPGLPAPDDLVTYRIGFPMTVRPGDGREAVSLDDEVELLRWAEGEFEDFQICFV